MLMCILEGVKTMPTLLGFIEKLRYLDHDVVDEGKSPEFVLQFYLDSIGIGAFGYPILQPNPWATSLANTGILNLVDIPHFGRGEEVKNCIK
jgi:hypothetical protein